MNQNSLFKLRDYQVESCTSTARALSAHRRALLVAPTASGKSIVVAELCRRIRAARKSRILVLCHQGHLLTQNETQIHRVCGAVDTGVYCADQGRKEHWNEIVLASRDSLGRNPEICGQFDFIICDEAHMIDPKCLEEKNETNYAKIFKAQKDYYCIGLTGTPWRLGNGHLVGKDTFFEVTSYEIEMDYLIEEGYLSPYTLPYKTETIIDTSELEVRGGGDYREADLEKVSATVQIIDSCLDIWQEKAADRKCSIFFCCSKVHAGKVKDLLGRRISPSQIAYIDGDITGDARRQLLKDIGEGTYKAIVNIGVLTTGADFPIIDCVVLLRATQSAALFIQMCLDLETEVLTTNGWKDYQTIAKNDIVYTYDIESGNICKSWVQNYVFREMYDGESFIQIDSRRSNFRVTDQHDLLAKSKGAKKFHKRQAVELHERREMFYYPTSGSNSKIIGSDLSNDQIRFVAWVLSDGSINKHNVVISQSKPEYISEIRDLLERLGFRFGESVIRAGTNSNFNRRLDNHRFNVSYAHPRRLSERHLAGCGSLRKYLIKNKMPFLEELNEKQFDVFMEVFIKADGRIVKDPRDGRGNRYMQKTFSICKSHEAISRLQMLAVINGYTADITEVRNKCSLLSVSKASHKTIAGQRMVDRPRLQRKEGSEKEKVWCIETDQGTIITRRNGKVTIMGNCGRGLRLHPGKTDCLMLDLAGNFDRFKSLSKPYVKKKGKSLLEGEGGGNGPGNKTCPACGYETPSAAAQCEKCFHIFISHKDTVKLGGYELTYRVESTHFEEYETRAGEQCVKVHFRLPDNEIACKFLLIYRKQTWADKHRKVWNQLNNIDYQPDLVKVTKKPGSKYEDVQIIKWRTREGASCCDWVEAQYSFIDYSQTVICTNCGEPI